MESSPAAAERIVRTEKYLEAFAMLRVVATACGVGFHLHASHAAPATLLLNYTIHVLNFETFSITHSFRGSCSAVLLELQEYSHQ